MTSNAAQAEAKWPTRVIRSGAHTPDLNGSDPKPDDHKDHLDAHRVRLAAELAADERWRDGLYRAAETSPERVPLLLVHVEGGSGGG